MRASQLSLAAVPRRMATTKRSPSRSICSEMLEPRSPKIDLVASAEVVTRFPSTVSKISPGLIMPDDTAGAPGASDFTASTCVFTYSIIFSTHIRGARVLGTDALGAACYMCTQTHKHLSRRTHSRGGARGLRLRTDREECVRIYT